MFHDSKKALLVFSAVALLMAVGCGKDPYDNPIANNSQQPDKVLFDKSIQNIENHRYDLGRITLQTLLNTYPDSEYTAKAKLAIADSWYRQGGSSGLAQAEAEYKDFITFFPSMEEAAESQKKVCQIHYEQLQKPDRANTHAVKADQECRQFMLQFPNSRFRAETEQMLRDVQELIAESEYRVGMFYTQKGSYRAGSNRLKALAEHYPLFSKSDVTLWTLAETYELMGEQFSEEMVTAYQRIVQDYPLSPWVDQAKEKLTALNRPIPDPDPERFELMKYNMEHQTTQGRVGQAKGMFSSRPNVGMAAKAGAPAMTMLMPSTPAGIRQQTKLGVEPSAEVSAETISGPSKLDTEPDARRNRANPSEAAEPQSGQQNQ